MQARLDVYSVAIFYLRCPIAKRSPLFLKAFENYVNMNLLFQLVAFFFVAIVRINYCIYHAYEKLSQ